MDLVNAVVTKCPRIPSPLSNRLIITTTCPLLPEEIQVFNNAFCALSLALSADKSVNPNMYINLVFTDSDTVSMSISDGDEWGYYVPMAIYPVHRWRMKNMNHIGMLACALEELCHHFWSIRDELLVQDKVIELIQTIMPNVRKSDVYNPNWTPGG